MSLLTSSLARRERERLCDTALAVGEHAPTLCGDWDVKHLVAHLLVRERSVTAAPGILIPALSSLTDRAMERTAREELHTLVERLRDSRLVPLALPLVDSLLNTLEYFVHHEDIRRAVPGWTPREVPAEDLDDLWAAIRPAGRGLVRPAGVPVTIVRADTGERAVLRRGRDGVVVTGAVPELVMFLFGRPEHAGLELTGPADAVLRLRKAELGI